MGFRSAHVARAVADECVFGPAHFVAVSPSVSGGFVCQLVGRAVGDFGGHAAVYVGAGVAIRMGLGSGCFTSLGVVA